MKDFFISYTTTDETWAKWIAGVLEEHGYTTVIQAWDFRPGNDFVLKMDEALSICDKTICVLSNKYISSAFCGSEWVATFAKDASRSSRKLIPVRIENVSPPTLLKTTIYIDLFGKTEKVAEEDLLNGIKAEIPREKPLFPGNDGTIRVSLDMRAISLKYKYNYQKNIIYMIFEEDGLIFWRSISNKQRRQFTYTRFQPMQFLILGADVYKGSVCYQRNNDQWEILSAIEMKHNQPFEKVRIHLFDNPLICDIDPDAKDFSGHIGL